MNKFKKLLSQGNDGIYERRVDALATQAEIAQQAIVNKLKQEKSKLEIELINLTDLSPETSDSLRPGSKNWNAQEWAKNIQRVKQELHTIGIQLDLAEETYKEYFGEEEVKEVYEEKKPTPSNDSE